MNGREPGRRFASVMPGNTQHLLGLAARTLSDGGRSGRAAVLQAGLSLIATPIDALLEQREQALRAATGVPEKPIIFVVGPPRSGTTIVAQTLARALPVSHLTNLTAMFPRSPLTAAKIFRTHPRVDAVSTVSHYGRTAALADHSDALPLWDRWIGSDRSALRVDMSLAQRQAIRGFFGAYEATYGDPVIAKNNNLVAYAHVIGSVLPTAVFLCLSRDPLSLAQSLLIARRQITGDEMIPYGLHPDRTDVDPEVLVDVVRQIDFYHDLASTQLGRLGPDRFRIVSYDAFCNDPGQLVRTLATEVLGSTDQRVAVGLSPLTRSAGQRVDTVELDHLRALLGMTRSTP